MPLILRETKGTKLTISEMDGNLTYLDNKSGGGVTEMIYSELIDAINGSSLYIGQKILLTDYQTVHYIQYSGPTASGGIGSEEVNIGTLEPLLLTATSENTLSIVAESSLYPQDTITYYPTMADYEYDYCEDQGKGCITYRKDNLLSISRDYDWRQVKFRRWETVIGNGKYLDVIPVTGASYSDSLGIGSDVQLYSDINIKSPLSLHPLLNGDYWLDNTILNLAFVGGIKMTISYANTFTYFELATASFLFEWNSNATVFNTVVNDEITLNSFGDFTSNNIITSTSSQQGLAGNTVGGCSSNTFEEFYLNVVGSIDNNSGTTIAGNNSSIINGNTSPLIKSNNVILIKDNVCSDSISGNVGSNIKLNICPQINGNIVNSIVDNTNTQKINGNVCDIIDNNTSNVTEITGNVGNEVGNCSNVGSIIYNNFANALTNITGTGSLDSLVGNIANYVDLNGDIKNSFNVDINTVTITNKLDNTIFNGKIESKTLNPTSNMQSSYPSVVKYDFGLNEFVEETLNSGSLTYSSAITF